MNVEFLASVAVVAADPPESRRLYVDGLGLPLESQGGSDYFASGSVGGCKHFGVWPLSEAAQACFGTAEWPADHPVPQASVEFEVADVAAVAGGPLLGPEAGLRRLAEGPDAEVLRAADPLTVEIVTRLALQREPDGVHVQLTAPLRVRGDDGDAGDEEDVHGPESGAGPSRRS